MGIAFNILKLCWQFLLGCFRFLNISHEFEKRYPQFAFAAWVSHQTFLMLGKAMNCYILEFTYSRYWKTCRQRTSGASCVRYSAPPFRAQARRPLIEIQDNKQKEGPENYDDESTVLMKAKRNKVTSVCILAQG